MSANVVTPPRICSAAASRVPQRTNSSFTFFASAGKMNFVSHSSSVTSSFKPRSKVIGTCVWPLMNPGRISLPRASIFFLMLSLFGAHGSPAPEPERIATISSPRTARKPSSRMRRPASIVTMVPPVINKSTDTASLDGVCACAEATMQRTNAQKSARPEIALYFAPAVSIFGFPLLIDWRSQNVCIRHHGNSIEAALTFADGFEYGDALGANGEAIGSVLDVATAKNSSGGSAQRGANAKIGVRRMRVFPRLPGSRNQYLIFAH